MQIYHNIQNFKANKPVLTIGAFDGVHLGHRLVINHLKEIAKQQGGETVIFTFYPHPRIVLAPENGQQELRLLTSIDERIELFRDAGVDHLVIYPFTTDFADLDYKQFVGDILVDKLGVDTLVLGYDHRLGKNRAGTYERLLCLSQELGFKLEKLDALLLDDINVSSTKIREALYAGEPSKANLQLGYEYQMSGLVVRGRQLGRTIQFPTANIQLSDPLKLVPKDGVYVVRVKIMGKSYGGMINIGTRPTVNINADNKSMEVHIFDFDANIYGREITVSFVQRIRDEQTFGSVELLRKQLEKDKQVAMQVLAN